MGVSIRMVLMLLSLIVMVTVANNQSMGSDNTSYSEDVSMLTEVTDLEEVDVTLSPNGTDDGSQSLPSKRKGIITLNGHKRCGLCDLKSSPSPACSQIVSETKPVYHRTCTRKWWRTHCTNKVTYTLVYKEKLTCCHGVLSGRQCHVVGCGGCQDKVVKNQPRCVPHTKSKYIQERYTVGCGWWNRKRCTKYRKKLVYYTENPPPCCSGYTYRAGCCQRR